MQMNKDGCCSIWKCQGRNDHGKLGNMPSCLVTLLRSKYSHVGQSFLAFSLLRLGVLRVAKPYRKTSSHIIHTISDHPSSISQRVRIELS